MSNVERPSTVFVLGCGRSGTTLLYDLLAAHGAFAWISTWTDRSGLPQLAAFNGIFRRTRTAGLGHRRGMPRPSEGYRLWNRALDLSPAVGVVDSSAVTPERIRRSQALAAQHRRFGRAEVFLNKNTRNARMMGLLADIFPDARFVHVLRSPLDVVSSLLEVAWWKDLSLWTRDGATPRQLAPTDEAEAVIAADLWSRETRAAREAGERIPERYLELRYEDLLDDPAVVSNRLLGWCGVEPSSDFGRALGNLSVRRRVDTHRERLTPRQQDSAWDRLSDDAAEFGYGRTVGRSGSG